METTGDNCNTATSTAEFRKKKQQTASKDQCSLDCKCEVQSRLRSYDDPSFRSQKVKPEDPVVQNSKQLDSSTWPDLCTGPQQRIIKSSCSGDKESFANKLKRHGFQDQYVKWEGNSSFASSSEQVRLDFQSQLMNQETPNCSASELHTIGSGATLSEVSFSSLKQQLIVKRKDKVSRNPRMLQKMGTPQDIRVKVVDASGLDQLMVAPAVDESQAFAMNKFIFSKDEFPDLSLPLKRHHKCSSSEPRLPCDGSEKETIIKPSDTNISNKRTLKKQPKSHDPISVDIMEILQESTNRNHLLQAAHFRRFEVRRCGPSSLNTLSTVVFKRGKHREIPAKKRCSKLKLVILEERKKKKKDKSKIDTACRDDGSLGRIEMDNRSTEETTGSSVFMPSSSSSVSTSAGSPMAESFKSIPLGGENENPTGIEGSPLSTLDMKKEYSEYGLNIDPENFSKECVEQQHTSALQEGMVSPSIHSRKFREYCNNMKSQSLDAAVLSLIKELYRFQDRTYKKDPIRAHAKRRFVLGIREVRKFLKLRKLKIVVIAPDIESINSPGGLDEAVAQIKEEGKLQNVPVVFAATRQKLGYVTMKKVPISVVGIISYDGAEDHLKKMLAEWKTAFDLYQEKHERYHTTQHQEMSLPSPSELGGDLEIVKSTLSKLMEGCWEDFRHHTSSEESEVEEVQESLRNLAVT